MNFSLHYTEVADVLLFYIKLEFGSSHNISFATPVDSIHFYKLTPINH